MNFKEKLQVLIGLIENWLSDPEDDVQYKHWHENVKELIYTLDCSESEELYLDKIVEMYAAQIKRNMKRTYSMISTPSKEILDALLHRKQIQQRTPAWYAQMATILSASELGRLFSSPRERGKLVMSKTEAPQPHSQPLTNFTDRMTAFDWGIRFEPVVKQIYEYKYGATIKELGRLVHETDPRCSASPDGLIYDCAQDVRTGRLIEIKCPVTREINDNIPKDYYSQMQMQLHVTGLQHCDYVEAVFSSKYKNSNNIKQEGPSQYNGIIALIRYAALQGDQEFYYAYSPINCPDDWKPPLEDEEELIEMIPWRLMDWSEHLVARNEEWWQSLKPVMNAFWEDVEKAKKGEFIVPESTRAAKKPKEEKCIIHFHKMDENGNECVPT
jgi:YqaJ-like viral recombinase domain